MRTLSWHSLPSYPWQWSMHPSSKYKFWSSRSRYDLAYLVQGANEKSRALRRCKLETVLKSWRISREGPTTEWEGLRTIVKQGELELPTAASVRCWWQNIITITEWCTCHGPRRTMKCSYIKKILTWVTIQVRQLVSNNLKFLQQMAGVICLTCHLPKSRQDLDMIWPSGKW